MNFLMTNPDGGAFFYIMRGIKNALEYLGHNVHYWNGTHQEIMDFKPDVYIGSSGWKQEFPPKAIDKFGTKLIFHVNPYAEHPYKIGSVENGPAIDEKFDDIEWVVKQNPKFVFGYFLKDDIAYWNNWIDIFGIPTYGIPTAADHICFYEVEIDKNFETDLSFVGGYWPYKSINIEKYLEPLRQKFGMRIHGWGGWDKRGSGPISDNDIIKLYSSTKICPCISEPHTSIYGIDIPERIFKVSLCGAMAISDPVSSIYKYFDYDIMPVAKDPNNYIELVGYYLKNSNKRIEIAKKQKKYILKYHTYLNRVATIFSGLGEIDELVKTNNKIYNLWNN